MPTTLTIDPRAIIYRIGSTLYIEAQAMPADTPSNLRALLQDATNTDNLPLLNIHLSDAIARLQEQLLAYIPTPDTTAAATTTSATTIPSTTVPSAGTRGVTDTADTPTVPSAGTRGISPTPDTVPSAGARGQAQPALTQAQSAASAADQPQQVAPRPPRLDPVTIQLNIPGAAPTTIARLQRLAAEYLTNHTLTRWLAITYPAKADHYNQQTLQNQLDITATLTHRTQPIRRRQHPF